MIIIYLALNAMEPHCLIEAAQTCMSRRQFNGAARILGLSLCV